MGRLRIHFLNVGKGDCTIIEHPAGRVTMVDIDDSWAAGDDTLTDPVEYFTQSFPGKRIFRFIATNPDMDHLSGLHRLTQKGEILNFWDTNHNRDFNDSDWEQLGYDKRDWDTYKQLRSSKQSPKAFRFHRDHRSEYSHWMEDNIEILSPTPHLEGVSAKAKENDAQKYNHLSYVLSITEYGWRIILGGDASREAWQSMYVAYGARLKTDALRAPHHGSRENFHRDAMKAMYPGYTIVSLGRGVDYACSEYGEFGEVWTTVSKGTIVLTLGEDGEADVWFERG